jgi:hypothetical protein
MSRHGDPHETFQVGGLTVNIWHDEHADSPDQWGDAERFIVSDTRDFSVERKDWYCSRFEQFMRPDRQESIQDMVDRGLISGADEPPAKPQDGPDDPRWQEVYMEHCTDKLVQILHAAGEEIDWDDREAMSAAYRDFGARVDLWDSWNQYRKMHAEWACFALDVCNYGGGHLRMSLGDIYDGDHTDHWGRQMDGPNGFVMIKREPGVDPEKAAEGLVETWNQYLEGDIWYYEIVDEDGEHVDGCSGYYGLDDCIAEARSAAVHYNKSKPSKETAAHGH